MEGEKLPLRVASGDNEYIRIQYNFCPQSIANSTVSRTLVHDEENPNYGIVEHVLENGETVNFKGNWKTPNDSQKECILVFRDNEVVLLPLSASVLHLKKTT
ncbi:hypothetical protein GPJ56_010140 [Histomonas meleagridis]|uniref:uncharacterized protein n=1 Tax=Histomonas meleagridis TaxID=135588 RepID=UPI00355ACC11|nr:hypothetical protein GPJ56_010140 [Histomonas meleagridis]KAH0798980.1 hypothetical protein GO595_008215 [Histomonas meleagridis]